MGLVQVSTETVTSAVASITLTGIDSDNTYMIYMNNVISASDNKDLYMQYIKASDSSPDSASNYDYATKGMLSSGSYQNNYNTDESQYIIQYARGNATGEQDNNILCLFNTFLQNLSISQKATVLIRFVASIPRLKPPIPLNKSK